MTFKELCESLEKKISDSGEAGVNGVEAELYAAQFLYAQMKISEELKKAQLNSRMRKTGVKSLRAAIYLDIVQKSEKKPTEAQVAAMIDSDKLVQSEQNEFDKAEVESAELERLYDIFANAHVYFRGVAKGNNQ